MTGVINTYASNLIEGHDTRPHDILRAVNSEPPQRGQEVMIQTAVKSARLQVAIDDDKELIDDLLDPRVIRFFHKALFGSTPELLEVPDATFCGIPGKARGAGMHVKVGLHKAARVKRMTGGPVQS